MLAQTAKTGIAATSVGWLPARQRWWYQIGERIERPSWYATTQSFKKIGTIVAGLGGLWHNNPLK